MAKKSMDLEFDVESTDCDRKTIDAVRETIPMSGDLQKVLEKKYPESKWKSRARKGSQSTNWVHHVVVSVDWNAVKDGIETAIAEFATMEFLKMAKDRVRNMLTTPTATKTKRKPTSTLGASKNVSTLKDNGKKPSAKSNESHRR